MEHIVNCIVSARNACDNNPVVNNWESAHDLEAKQMQMSSIIIVLGFFPLFCCCWDKPYFENLHDHSHWALQFCSIFNDIDQTARLWIGSNSLYKEGVKTTSGTLVYCFKRQTAWKIFSSFQKHRVLNIKCRILSQEHNTIGKPKKNPWCHWLSQKQAQTFSMTSGVQRTRWTPEVSSRD